MRKSEFGIAENSSEERNFYPLNKKSSLVTRLHLQGELAKSQILTEGSSRKECLRGERNEKCIYKEKSNPMQMDCSLLFGDSCPP